MEQVLADEVVRTDYGQFEVVWSDQGGFDGDVDRFFANQINGLVGAGDPHGVYVSLGRRSGGSHVRIVSLPARPDEPSTEWEDVVEVSIRIPAGTQPEWSSWARESHGPLDLHEGSWRLRVSARGRDEGAANEFADDVLDHYLLEFWPSPPADDAVLRVTSDNAHNWHKKWGGRR